MTRVESPGGPGVNGSPMPRHGTSPKTARPPRGPARFKGRDITRVLRAARRAGEAVDRVEIDAASGKFAVILAKQVTPGGDKNPWDEVLTNAAHEERSA